MHGDSFLSLLTSATIPIILPSSMPTLCAAFGARSPSAMLLFLQLMLDRSCKSALVHLHADGAGGICARSQLEAGPYTRAGAPEVERNTVPAFQPPR